MAITESRAADIVLWSTAGAAAGILVEIIVLIGVVSAGGNVESPFTGFGSAIGGAAGLVYGLISSRRKNENK